MTGSRAAALAGLIALVVAGCGGTLHHRHVAGPAATARTTVSGPTRPTGPATLRASSAITRLRRSLQAALRAAGPNSGAVVYDLSSGRTLFTLRGGVPRPPASVEKLYTTVAVLDDLGPGTRLQTTVLGSGHLSPGGIWHGDLYLRGGGDPSFGDGTFNRVWESGYGPTAEQLVGQLRGAGIRAVTGRVIGDASLFDSYPGVPSSDFAPDIPDLGGQLAGLTYDHGSAPNGLSAGAFAARQLARALHAAGVRARAARRTRVTPPGAHTLASVSSPPVSVLLRLTDVPSDDFFAEMLTKQLGVRVGSGGTTAEGASVIAGVISHLGVTPRIVDGSGLSRQDQSSPFQVVQLLRSIWPTPTGQELLADLPVVGIEGTVSRLALHSPAQGRCRAKTGTLNYVTNLAGYCQARGGRAIAFALFLDGPTNLRGFALLGRMAAAIARY